MSRVSSLAVAIFACAAFAHAESVRLVAPASGATLRGGSFAELHWSAAQLSPSTEEWEAFLSIDGGKYYAFRITPHLDIDVERFTFVVPNVDTRNARILIRTGNEVHETHFESPGRFAIARDPNAELVVPRLLQSGRGEAARDGDPAVVAWTDRSGVVQQSSTRVPPRSFTRVATRVHDVSPVIASAVLRGHSFDAPVFLRAEEKAVNRRCRLAVDLLLMCGRRNV